MKNPLNKRLPRELKSNLVNTLYYLFFGRMIALVSGFLVADGSMLKAYEQKLLKSIISKMVILNWMKKCQMVRCRRSTGWRNRISELLY